MNRLLHKIENLGFEVIGIWESHPVVCQKSIGLMRQAEIGA